MLFSIFAFYMALAKLLAAFVLILLIVPLISEKNDGLSKIPFARSIPLATSQPNLG
jgi:hypothetical protein